MRDRILVDTSAWIEGFRKSGDTRLQRRLMEGLDSAEVMTTNIIVLELLQGCRDEKEYTAMKSRLEALETLPADEKAWETAYAAGFSLKRGGITVPTVDLIIASIAKSNDCKLFHHDRHFDLIAKRLDLQTISFLIG